MKLQWKSVSEEQERRNSRLRDYRSLIGEEEALLWFVCQMVLLFILFQFSTCLLLIVDLSFS